MQPQGSLPCSQEPRLCSRVLPQMNQVYMALSYFFKIHFNITLLSKPRYFFGKMIYEWWARSGRGLTEIRSPSCTWRDWVKPWETLLSLCPCLDTSVGIATGYGLDGRGAGVRVPVESRFFFCPRRPYRFWGPLSLLSNGYLGLFPGGKAARTWSCPLTSN
jgi:hypothetical protein